MIEINGTKKRNLQEQVLKNKEDIEDLQSGVTSPAFEDITGSPSDNSLLNAALNAKVDKVTGKGLSTNDFTNADKTKLDGIDMSTKQDALSATQLTAVNSGVTATDVTMIGALNTQMANKQNKLPTYVADRYLKVATDGTTLEWAVGGGSGVWGSITGTLSNQTDLWSELNSKLNATAITAYRTSADQDTIDTGLRALIVSETTRATNAETTLQTNINAKLDKTGIVEGRNIDITYNSSGNPIIACSIEGMEFKGSVATYADLPSGAANGDTYIVNSNHNVYTMTSSGWVQSGTAFDQSNFYTKTESDAKFALKSNPTFTGTANLEDANVTGNFILDKGATFVGNTGAELSVQCDATFGGTNTTLTVNDDVTVEGLIKELGNEAVSGEAYHFGYYFSITPSANDITVTEKTITLDNNKTITDYTLTVPAATTTTAGLLTASDKVKLDGIADSSKLVTTDTAQEITGTKTFQNGGIKIKYTSSGQSTYYAELYVNAFKPYGLYVNYFPQANTTLLGESDIVDNLTSTSTTDCLSANQGKVLNDKILSMQNIYDALMPVNTIMLGLTQPNVPTGVTATWTDVSSTYNGRYLKVDSSNSAGTSQAESLPIPTISTSVTVNQVTTTSTGAHTHTISNINPGTNYINTNHTSGASYQVPTRSTSYSTSTGSSGAHTHTFTPTATATSTASGSVYSSGGAVRPLTTTIKVWKRTA